MKEQIITILDRASEDQIRRLYHFIKAFLGL